MDFKATSTDRRTRRRCAGVGAVEFMVAIAVGSLLILAVMSVFVFSGRSFAAMGNYADLDAQSRAALDSMTRDIRMARNVYLYGNSYVFYYDLDGALHGYWFDSTEKKLWRWPEWVPILTGCQSIQFDFRQRTPQGGQYEYFQISANPQQTCKLLRMNWVCSRASRPGLPVNTETVQSARVVLRNQ